MYSKVCRACCCVSLMHVQSPRGMEAVLAWWSTRETSACQDPGEVTLGSRLPIQRNDPTWSWLGWGIEKCGGGQGVGLEGGRDVAVEEKGADAVVEGAEDTLGTVVLLRCIWTG